MRKSAFIGVLAALLSILLLFGCSRQPDEQTGGEETGAETGTETQTTPPAETVGEDNPASSPADVSGRSASEEMKDQGKVVLRYDIQYPQVRNLTAKAEAAINGYFNDIMTADLQVIDQYYEEARLMFQQAADNNEDMPNQYSYDKSYSVVLNNGRYVSFMLTNSVYTGGAHGIQVSEGATFDSATGAMLLLGDLFSVDESVYMKRIHNEIIKKINAMKEESPIEDFPYFENYEENVKVPDYTGKWVLTSKGLVIIYDIYTLAPYAAGMPTFELGYESLSDIMKVKLP